MTIQVLISTMHQTDHSLLERMNIQTDAIVINQCDRNEIECFTFRGNDILWMSMKERGVGLSRNTALMRATADVVLIADDDLVYENGYAEQVLSSFERLPKQDMLIFRLESINPERLTEKVGKEHSLHWYNSLKYGAVRIALRTAAIRKANVFFSLLFGGGAQYQAGEDTLFIRQCQQRGMKCFVLRETIGIVKQEESTWFKGHTDQYFYDKGVLMKHCFGISAWLLVMALILKSPNQYEEIGLRKALSNAFMGMRKG